MSLAKKLMIKPDMQVAVLNAPEGYPEAFGEMPAGVSLVTEASPGTLDALVLFVKSLAELEAEAPGAMKLVKYDAPAWIAYPKKSSKIKTDINRDNGWERMSAIGYVGVAMIALDDTWSAMRYRPADRVGK